VNIRLLLDTVNEAVVIPTVAVQIGPQSSFVYVVKPDNTIEQRTVVPTPTAVDTLTVVTGHTEGEMMSIQSGLKAGELVVTDGFDKLQQGVKVTVAQPGAAKPQTTSTE
jgi:multidrug efflux system membrane fusion protein